MNIKSKIRKIKSFPIGLVSEFKTKVGEKVLFNLLPNGFYFACHGYCPCCITKTTFVAKHNWLRDHFLCANCGCIPRERALTLVLEKHFPDWKNAAIHESSPGGRGASLRLKQFCSNYVATHYFSGHPLGEMVGRFRNENLEQQTFSDNQFDIVVTQDVMEHVFNPDKAFAEIARTLQPGGAHIFTVPLVNKHQPSQTWSILNRDGDVEFLHEPEYHGNPVDSSGSPVTMHWGYDIISFIKEKTSLDTTIEYIDDLNFGVRAEYIEVLVTRKPE